MKELWLTFADEYGATKRVLVDGANFTIGRHPENNLCISDGRLSRTHCEIEIDAGDFIVADCNSSNGTTLNGERLTRFVRLGDGDKLSLGGFPIKAEIVVERARETKSAAENLPVADVPAQTAKAAAAPPKVSASVAENSIPTFIFWLAPVFGLLILIVAGGLFLAFSPKKPKEVVQNDDNIVYADNRKPPKTDEATDETPTPKPEKSTETNAANTPPDANVPTPPKPSGDAEKIEQNSAAFLRRIALNDDKAFLTDKQLEAVAPKINQLKNSGALAANLKAIQKNAAEFETLASSQNLKPQMLAAAALAKMGNNGDVLATAKTMLPTLGALKITLDNKFADDNLLIIAGYERGAAGKPRALQSIIEAIAKKAQGISPREIRTIWFLRERDKITDAEFNFALQFIAIGTIMQNPKDFNVNADAVVFK